MATLRGCRILLNVIRPATSARKHEWRQAITCSPSSPGDERTFRRWCRRCNPSAPSRRLTTSQGWNMVKNAFVGITTRGTSNWAVYLIPRVTGPVLVSHPELVGERMPSRCSKSRTLNINSRTTSTISTLMRPRECNVKTVRHYFVNSAPWSK